jgi:LCP family protein required for cell wall assembly
MAEFAKIPQNVSSFSNNLSDDVSKISVGPHLENRMNLLLMGVDSNGRHSQRFANTRSDTMIVASIDPESKTVGLVSIPRDSRVRIADGHGMDKINSAHALGGPDLAMETVRQDFGISIDHYVVIDVQGLKKLFEILGPADVLVEKRMRYTDHAAGLHVALDPGMQTLTPLQMEEYVRFRHDQRGDLGRIERQQWFLRQVSQKLHEPQVVLKLPELFSLASEYVVTDLSIEDMAKLAAFGKDIKPNQVKTAMLPGRATFVHGGSYWIPDAYGSAIVFNRLLGTNLTESEAGRGLTVADEPATDSPDEAYAATEDTKYGVSGRTTLPTTDKAIITIKYAKGTEPAARKLEKSLVAKGYRVKYIMRVDAADCAHEQLQQTSVRADNDMTDKLIDDMPLFKTWAVNIALDQRASQDLTIIVSPTVAPLILQTLEKSQVEATTDKKTI